MSKEDKTKKCSKCGRQLPLERFRRHTAVCKSCSNGFGITEENAVKIERIYKKPFPERILDTKQAGIKLISQDECFVQLINYKKAWISNYGRILEYNDNKYVLKRTKINKFGEKTCKLQKNIYNGKKWVWKKQSVEIWRLVVGAFIVNFDIAGNTRCWHKNNDKLDNYYKHIYPMNDKQYKAVLERYSAGEEVTEDVIYNIVNDILYKADDWYANKWKRTVFDIGYLGCNDIHMGKDDGINMKWRNMIARCYDPKTHKLKPYYALCTADIEWLNFSNYREWHKENAMGNNKLDLDKDVLIQGNTVYSPDTCTLIPHFINTIFEERGLETNIVLNNKTGKYDVTMSVLGKREDVGTFDTEEEARQGFLDYKKNYIRTIAQKSKGKVPNKTYEAMMNWKV